MNTKKVIAVILLVVAAFNLSAQAQAPSTSINDKVFAIDSTEFYQPHRFSVYGLVGYSSLLYRTADEASKGFVGGGGAIDYAYFISKRWGLGIGANFMHYGTSFNLNTKNVSEERVSPFVNKTFVLHETIQTDEKQAVGYVGIPIKAHFRTYPFNNKNWELNAAVGVQLGIPVYESTSMTGTIERQAYFADDHVLITPDNTTTGKNLSVQEGIGIYNTFVNKVDDKNFGLDFGLLGQVGFAYKFNELVALDFGAFASYGLRNVKAIESPTAAVGHYSGVTTSGNIGGINTLFAGLKVGVNFDFSGCKGKRPTAKARRLMEQNEMLQRFIDAQVQDTIITYNCSEELLDEAIRILKDLSENQVGEPIERTDALHALSNGRFMYIVWDFNIGSAEANASVTKQLKSFTEKEEIKDAEDFILIGRADDTGTNAINNPLSVERANTVKNWLIRNTNAKSENVSVEGRGSEDPLAASSDLNRSVVIIF